MFWYASKNLIVGFFSFVLLDLFWLGFLTRDFYANQLVGKLRMDHEVMIWSAFIVWLLLVIGLYVFVLPKASSLAESAAYGALYGLIIYGVYDLTNYAILADWPIAVLIVDILWGVAVNCMVAMLMFVL